MLMRQPISVLSMLFSRDAVVTGESQLQHFNISRGFHDKTLCKIYKSE